MRYFNILLFIIALGAAGFAGDWLLQTAGTGLSLRDPRGPGQVLLFVLVIGGLLFFMHLTLGLAVAADFARAYARNWRRVLKGLGAMVLVVSLIVLAGYLAAGAMGQIRWSQEGLENLSLKVAERTFVGLFVVLILATSEELIFRGFLLRYLRWNATLPVTIAAVIVSAAIFSISHVIAATAEGVGLELLFGLFLLGVLLGTTYVVTGSLACSIGVHAGLLGSKVFLRKTSIIEVDTAAWWLDSADLRTTPLVWALFVAMTLAVILARHVLHRRFAVESVTSPAVVDRSSAAARPNPAE